MEDQSTRWSLMRALELHTDNSGEALSRLIAKSTAAKFAVDVFSSLATSCALAAIFLGCRVAHAQLTPPPVPERQTYPLLMVQEIQIVWFGDGSHGGVVYARGLASASESNAAQLISIPDGVPVDKMLDLAFVAPMLVNPTGTMAPVEATFEFKGSSNDVLGARVRAASNVLETAGASVLSPDPVPPDLPDLTGRKASLSLDGNVEIEGLKPDQVKNARLVRVDDPLRQSDVNPNRLTVFVGRDSRILYARWN
jgi:hypothetical protein